VETVRFCCYVEPSSSAEYLQYQPDVSCGHSRQHKHLSLAICNPAIHLLAVDCMSKRTVRAERVFVCILQDSKCIKRYAKHALFYLLPAVFVTSDVTGI
jgi:hypothetical protein